MKIQVCSKISERFGKHGLVKPKEAVRSLATPLRMYDGLDETETRKKQPEALDGPVLSERDKAKLDRRKRKEERQRQVSAMTANSEYDFPNQFYSVVIKLLQFT